MTTRKLAAAGGIASAFALTAALLLAPVSNSTLATAAEGTPANLIDASHNGSLTIHKCKATGTTKTATGKEDSSAQCEPISGVEFTIQQLDFDLTTDAGWKALADESAKFETDKSVLDSHASKTGKKEAKESADDGTAKFNELPVAAYLVKETNVANAKSGEQPIQVIAGAPFVVTIPMTDPEAQNTWMYDIHVYPKNSEFTATKKVSDGKATKGGTVSYTITTGVQALGEGQELDSYRIYDPMHPALKFEANAQNLTVTAKKSAEAVEGDVVLNFTDDYTAQVDQNNRLKIELTKAGLKKVSALANGNAQGVIVVEMKNVKVGDAPKAACDKWAEGMQSEEAKAAAKAVCEHDGDAVHNWAFVLPNGSYSEGGVPPTYPGEDPDQPGKPNLPVPPGPTPPDPEKPEQPLLPPVPTNDEVTRFGSIKIVKKSSGAEAKVLEGAEFQISHCEGDNGDKAGEPLKFGESTAKTFTTDDKGEVVIDGIKLNTFTNGAADKDTEERFCIVETKAPAGYELLAKPVVVKLDQKANEATVNLDQEIINVPKNAGFHLPLTGAHALLAISIAGIALLLVGVVLVANRRRAAE